MGQINFFLIKDKNYLYGVNVFVIPSWYPSKSNPIYGTFVKEQFRLMADSLSDDNFGVSCWGQGAEPFLLYARQPFRSLIKRLKRSSPYRIQQSANLVEYFTPAYTWTKRWRKGNLDGIIEANRINLRRFQEENGKVSIIHAQASWPAAWVAYMLSREMGIPYVVTLRMSPFPFPEYLEKSGQLDEALSQVLNEAQMLVATSSSLKEQAGKLGLSHVVTVNNPVDMNLFDPGEGSEQKSGTIKLLAVGRLELQKGFDLLIRAMDRLSTNYELEIVGGGSQHKQLLRLINKLNLGDKVQLVGELNRSDVAAKMKSCNLFVLSSRHETFGNVLLEAMACGKPVVATKCGGPTDIVTSKAGILCENGNLDALVRAISDAAAVNWSPDSIRNHVMENFSSEQFSKKMKRIYTDVVRLSS